MPGPQGFPQTTPYNTASLIQMLTALSRQKNVRQIADSRMLIDSMGQLGGALAGQQRRKDVKAEGATGRIHDRDMQRRRQDAYDTRAKASAKDAAANAAAKAAAAEAKALERVRANLAKARDKADKDPMPGGSHEVRHWEREEARLLPKPAQETPVLPPINTGALDRAPTPQVTPGEQGAPTPKPQQPAWGDMAQMYGPPPPAPAAPSARRGVIARPPPTKPSKRSRQFMAPLSTTGQSFQINKVLKADPAARRLGADSKPETELGAFYKEIAERIVLDGLSVEEVLDEAVGLLNDPSFVNKNLRDLTHSKAGSARRDLVSTPYFLAHEKGAPAYVVDMKTGEQFLNQPSGGLLDAPRVLKGVVESVMPGSTSLEGPPPGSTVQELQKRLGGQLVRRGSPIDALGTASMITGQGALHLRISGTGLAKYHPALAPETLLQWLRRVEASRQIR